MTWEGVKMFVRATVSQVAHFGVLGRTGADGRDELVGRSEPDEPSYGIDVRRMGSFGFRGRPPAGTECVVLSVNGSLQHAVVVAAESATHGPADLLEGEASMYCSAADTRVKLDALGNVRVDAAAGVNVAFPVSNWIAQFRLATTFSFSIGPDSNS